MSMKKAIVLLALLFLVACSENNIDVSPSSNTLDYSVLETKNNGGAAQMSVHRLNQKCETLKGESLTITNYSLEDYFLLLNTYLCINSLKDLCVARGNPACLSSLFSDALNENVAFSEEKTLNLNNLNELTSDPFNGVFSLAFSIKSIEEVNYPLYFRFFVVEKGCVDSNFVIG